MNRTLVSTLLGPVALALAHAASGQAPGDPPGETTGLQEIVVTAQKREQNLQDVPIAISAIAPDYIEKHQITTITSLTSLAPNLKIDPAGANQTTSTIAIRGNVQGNPQLYFEPSVGLYLDGVYIGKAQGSIFDVADIERIEVLRGPQGTLYGRNTVGGAVNIIAKKPSGEWGGKVEASYGNFDYWRVRGSLDLPRFGFFSAKLSGQMAERAGFYDVAGNPATDEAQTLDSKSVMLQLRAEPTEALVLDYVFDLSVVDQQAGYGAPISGVGTLAPYVFPRKRPENVSFNSPNYEYARNHGHALTAALRFGDAATLKSITAYREQTYHDALDLDGSPLSLGLSSRDTRYRQLSQEFQLSGRAARLNYVAGLYYFEDDGFVFNPQSFFNGFSRVDSRFGFTTRAYAAYAQGDYELTDSLTLTAGLRYTDERKTIERYFARLAPVQAVVINLPDGAAPDASFSKLSPTATLAYKINPDVNVYARYAQGYRSGGFNGVSTTVADVLTQFQPQTQNSYEIGLKSRLFDNRATLNVAAFWDESKDLQLSVFRAVTSAASTVVNAGAARVRGIEIEAGARPVESLFLQAAFGYLDAEYKRYIDAGVDVADNRSFPYAPKYSFSTSVQWTALQRDFGKLDLIVDLSRLSGYYQSAAALRPASPTEIDAHNTHSPGRTMLDARAILSEFPMGGLKGELSLWGRNLLNEDDPQFFIDFGANFQRLAVAYFPDPRTYGMTLSVRF